MANPRNQTSAAAQSSDSKEFNPDSWKYMTLGSASVKNGKTLVRENDVNFTINTRNAEIIRDLAQFVIDNAEKDERISLNASPFYENSVSDKVLQHFSHRLYVSAEAVGKMGKKFSDYIKEK